MKGIHLEGFLEDKSKESHSRCRYKSKTSLYGWSVIIVEDKLEDVTEEIERSGVKEINC